jgi:hypothetical protein
LWNDKPRIFSKNATNEQRRISQDILWRSQGEGCFVISKPTFKYVLEPQFLDIIAKIDGKKSGFSVHDKIIDVEVETHRNPLTGEEQDT